MPAAGTAQTEVHAAAQDKPLLRAAGCSFFMTRISPTCTSMLLSPSFPRLHILEQELGGSYESVSTGGLYPQPEGYTREDLLLAMQQRKILQAAAIKCDERHNLHVALGCCKGIIPRAEAARGILGGETRDIAILSRVGRPICFTVMGFAPDGTALLSRRSAQEAALEQIFRENRPGDILPAVVTGLAPFGAFCDIGCGASGLLGLRNLCVSRLTHPGDLLRVGQRLPVLIQSLDPARRRVALTLQGTARDVGRKCSPVPSRAKRARCRLRKDGLRRFYRADTESVWSGRTRRYVGARPAGMCIHQGHPPRDAQAEADRPASAGRAAARSRCSLQRHKGGWMCGGTEAGSTQKT